MKKFKSLLITGLIITLVPIFSVIVVFTMSHYGGQSDNKIQKYEKRKEIYFDTVRVKVVDTVFVKKIKYIKKQTSDSSKVENP